jgi:hypothetical protein
MNNDDQPATRRDLEHAVNDLKNFVIDRELIVLRWVMGVQITYFFGTLAALWFILAHYKP